MESGNQKRVMKDFTVTNPIFLGTAWWNCGNDTGSLSSEKAHRHTTHWFSNPFSRIINFDFYLEIILYYSSRICFCFLSFLLQYGEEH